MQLKQMKIRLSPDLHKWVKNRAKENMRPISSEIKMILIEQQLKEKLANAEA